MISILTVESVMLIMMIFNQYYKRAYSILVPWGTAKAQALVDGIRSQSFNRRCSPGREHRFPATDKSSQEL